ncbi:MAG: SDR family oxidoreductase [Deltaproteobacteria bacterium]|nr:SDR family oxidoreductase [Deltaproteobacteria bacterium]
MDMSKILITGGAGFIGSNMAEAFLKKGYAINILDNFSTGNIKNIETIKNNVSFFEGDICDPSIVSSAMKGCDFVFHLAALRSVPKSFGDPTGYEKINVIGTIVLLEEALKNKIKKFVLASSSSVYGDNVSLPLKEEYYPDPISPYAISKLNAEVYCRMYFKNFGLPTVSLRYFNVFGPRQSLENKYAVVIPKFIQSLNLNESPPIYGDGKQSRDFTFVENVIAAHESVLKSNKANGKVFNAACGNRTTVNELVQKLNKLIKKDIKPKYLDPRPGDVLHTQASIEQIQKYTDFKPQTTFEQGLQKTVNWFLKHQDYLIARS